MHIVQFGVLNLEDGTMRMLIQREHLRLHCDGKRIMTLEGMGVL